MRWVENKKKNVFVCKVYVYCSLVFIEIQFKF